MIYFIIMACLLAVVIFAGAMLHVEKQKIPADVVDKSAVLRKTVWFNICGVATVAFIGVFISLISILGISSAEASRLYDESETLNLYVDMVSESDNEYMRYHFWNEVKVHNSRVDYFRTYPESKWCGWFILDDTKYENIPYVNFSLNGG